MAVQAGDVTVILTINALGQPELSVRKGDKSLKSVPPSAKKEPEVAALQERYREIERQAARMRRSLEQAMCRGDRFTVRELGGFPATSRAKSMLRALIFSGDGAIGYPTEAGRALDGHDGSTIMIDLETSLRIAHPYDLLHTDEWPRWQRDCFLRERVQPFKQVFRELYVLTDAEQTEGHGTRRYEGHQVNLVRPGVARTLRMGEPAGRGGVPHLPRARPHRVAYLRPDAPRRRRRWRD